MRGHSAGAQCGGALEAPVHEVLPRELDFGGGVDTEVHGPLGGVGGVDEGVDGLGHAPPRGLRLDGEGALRVVRGAPHGVAEGPGLVRLPEQLAVVELHVLREVRRGDDLPDGRHQLLRHQVLQMPHAVGVALAQLLQVLHHHHHPALLDGDQPRVRGEHRRQPLEPLRQAALLLRQVPVGDGHAAAVDGPTLDRPASSGWARAGGCIRREGAPEAAPEAVRGAVGGGCRSGWGRLLSVANAIEPGTWG